MLENDIMDLIIFVNSHYEEERALVELNTKKIFLSGDYYHDKIDEKIDGYLQALSDFNIYDKVVTSEYIDETNEYYSILGFYNEDE